MMSLRNWIADEAGAVTVDWVVLASAGAVTALVLATIWEDAFVGLTLQVEEEAAKRGMIASGCEEVGATGECGEGLDWVPAGTWAAAMRDYPPFNPLLYERLVTDFKSLEDAKLDEMERFVNAYYAAALPFAQDNVTNQGIIDDLDFAMGRAYAERQRERPNDKGEVDRAAIATITQELGWTSGIVSGAFEGAQEVAEYEAVDIDTLIGGAF
jgi:hypothetical protein